VHTDESRLYNDMLDHVESHEAVRHSAGEYVRGDVHTNSVEGYFSIFKRGMKGIYQHCAEKHLHRYLAVSAITIAFVLVATISNAPIAL
jgi:hypothetical protein